MPNEWQPIETAPKDGTFILAAADEAFGDAPPIAVVQWYAPPPRIRFVPHPTVANAFVESLVPSDYEGWWEGGPVSPFHATHWMPLPPPPEAP